MDWMVESKDVMRGEKTHKLWVKVDSIQLKKNKLSVGGGGAGGGGWVGEKNNNKQQQISPSQSYVVTGRPEMLFS